MIIGLVGKKGSGKTTVASYLVEKYGFKKYAFSDELKSMMLNAGMCTYNELYKEKTELSRWLMQKIGTDLIRNQIDSEFWVKGLENKIILDNYRGSIVIEDIRFKNEALCIERLCKKFGVSTIIKIERDVIDDSDNHLSETELDSIPYQLLLNNNNSIKTLLNIVDNAYTVLASWSRLIN